MAFSMTGFGKGSTVSPEKKCTVEIKSVNSKFCDMQIRIPRQLISIENKIRKEISAKLRRGKIDVYVNYEDYSPAGKKVIVDEGLVMGYFDALKKISGITGTKEKITASAISRLGDVINSEPAEINEEETWSFVKQSLTEAIEGICRMRKSEGDALVANIISKAIELQEVHQRIVSRAPHVAGEFALKLKKRIEDLSLDLDNEKIDEQRLAMEIALFSDKCSIDEEIVRLESHLKQLRNIMDEEGPVGKKTDFLIQEINRETNTIGSKANDLEITQNVVIMKTIIENIREQIQNLE